MRNLRTLSRRAGALLLAGVTLLSSTALAVGDGVTPTYDEAYYGTLDYYGNLTEGSVVKSYILNGATSITDYGTYDNVDNLTDATVPSRSGSATTFDFGDSAPSHFYFEGKTAKPFETLPWTLSVKYLLNGVPTKAENLAGKTGMVEIDVDAIPNKSVSDYVRHNYTLAVTTLFNQDNILSLEAPGAQVQLVGNLRAVLFLALPGEEHHFEIRVGAEDFEFTGLTFLLVPATLSQVEDLSDLARQKEDLEDYYRRLSGSLDDVVDSLDGLGNNLRSAASGLDALNSARGTVSAGKSEVYERAESLRRDLEAMNAALEPVNGDLETTSAALADTKAVLAGATTDVTDLRKELDGLKSILTQMQKSNGDLTGALDDVAELEARIKKLQESKKDLNNVIGDLAGMEKDFDDMYKDLNTLSATGTNITPVSLFDSSMTKTKLQSALTQERELRALFNGMKGGDGLIDLKEFICSAMRADSTAVHSPAEMASLSTAYTADDGIAPADYASDLVAPAITTGQALNGGTPLDAGEQLEVQKKVVGMYLTKDILTDCRDNGITSDAEILAALKDSDSGLNSRLALLGSSATDTEIEALYAAILQADAMKNAYTVAGSGDPLTYDKFLYGMLFLSPLYANKSAQARADAQQLYTLNQLDQNGQAELLISQFDTLQASVSNINDTINQVNKLAEDMAEPTADVAENLREVAKDVDQLTKLVNSTDELLTQAADMTAKADQFQNLVDSADELAGLGRETADQLTLTLNDLDALYGVLDTYEPRAQDALVTAESLIDSATRTITDTTSFTSTLEELLKASGNQLDAGTRQALGSLSSTLRKTATSFDATDSVREAKDSINDIIEDIWDNVTGDKMDVLDMDATANPVSLTDTRNPAPQSVQVILRTQEIKVEDDADDAGSNAGQAEAAPATFLDRLVAIFKGIWAAVTGLFHR